MSGEEFPCPEFLDQPFLLENVPENREIKYKTQTAYPRQAYFEDGYNALWLHQQEDLGEIQAAMPLSETDLQQMSYREVVELAKENGVYQKKSAKKAALIRRLSTVWTNEEFTGIENVDPIRASTLTPLKEVDESLVSGSDCEDQERRRTFTKVKKAVKRKTSDPKVKSTDPPKRQNTFTKSDEPDLTISTIEEESPSHDDGITSAGADKDDPSSQPQRDDEPILDSQSVQCSNEISKSGSLAPVPDSPKPIDSPSVSRRTRCNTFTKENAENEGNLDFSKNFVREDTFTKTPEKKEHEIPVLQLNKEKTPPIEKLSVFQRLSTKIPLSERRSLVMSEKRASIKTSFYTPQSDKRSQLNALREARKNHTTPKSLAKMMVASAVKTPVQPIMKSSATSTKKSSVKKPPNFAEIHKRHFAKMESLLEHKKRLRERAAFMSPVCNAQTSSFIPKRAEGTSALSKSSGKRSNIPILQKKQATKDRLRAAMANKCPTGAVILAKDKKILKGVRTNKRFELQLALKQKKT